MLMQQTVAPLNFGTSLFLISSFFFVLIAKIRVTRDSNTFIGIGKRCMDIGIGNKEIGNQRRLCPRLYRDLSLPQCAKSLTQRMWTLCLRH